MSSLRSILFFIVTVLSVDANSSEKTIDVLVERESVIINGQKAEDIEGDLKKGVSSGAQTVSVRACHQAPIELLQSVIRLCRKVGYKTINLKAVEC